MKKAPKGQFLWGAFTLSFAALFTACQGTPTRTATELRRLQGYWEGDAAAGKSSITITGNSLQYRAGTNWWKTTFTLPAGTAPQQLHATIKESSPPTNGIGQVVFAIFKIEDGTLTFVTFAEDDMSDKSPKAFANATSRYSVKKVHPQKENAPKPNEPQTP